MLFPMLNVLYIYISIFLTMYALFIVADFVVPRCRAFRYVPQVLLNDFEIVPVAHIITGITTVFTFHMRCIYMGADKSLSRPGRKQATATEDFGVHISYLLS